MDFDGGGDNLMKHLIFLGASRCDANTRAISIADVALLPQSNIFEGSNKKMHFFFFVRISLLKTSTK